MLYELTILLRGEIVSTILCNTEEEAQEFSSKEIRRLIETPEYNHLFFENFESQIREVPCL